MVSGPPQHGFGSQFQRCFAESLRNAPGGLGEWQCQSPEGYFLGSLCCRRLTFSVFAVHAWGSRRRPAYTDGGHLSKH
eukprot:5240078-Pyramimonas_sp.AAC.1